jgi:prohibitin 1
MAGAAPEGAAALVGLLNKVMKYAVGLGVGASVLQTALFTGRAAAAIFT